MLSVLVFILVLWILLQTAWFQTWLVKEVAGRLSKSLHAKVSIRNVDFELFNKMLLNGTLVLDQKKDTLLYAGTAKVNITDWFFLKETIVLKYVGLENAFLNLNRADSVWNYQFMVDYFSSPSKKKDTSKNVVKLDLKIVELNKVKILQKDKWMGQDLLVSLNSVYINTDEFDMNNNLIRINSLKLDQPLFSQYEYKGLRPPKTFTLTDSVNRVKNNGDELQWNTDDWQFSLKDLTITNGRFAIEKISDRPALTNRFDDKHIILSSISGHLKNIEFKKDTLTADVNLSAKERSGFEVKKLTAIFKFTPSLMEFAQLDLVTNNSRLRDYYAMKYDSFSDAMSDFEHSVALKGRLNNSKLSSSDLAYFAPEVKDWKKNFSLKGVVEGTIDNLSAHNVIIESGSDNYFNGDVSMKGLPDINSTFIDLNSNDLRTTYDEFSNIVPSLKSISSPNLRALGSIRFTGKFTGFINDFVAYGTITTTIGSLKTDLNMKFSDNGSIAYSGKVFTNNFQLGKFIDNNSIGNVSFDGKVSGNDFSEKNMELGVDGVIKEIEFNKYKYQNILAKGTFKNRLFEGAVNIDDPNIKIGGLVGSIDFNLKEPQFNFEADVETLNLKNLNFTNDSFSLTGKFNINFSGNNIDNFLGFARIYNATLFNGNQRLSFDSLTVNSVYLEGKKNLTVQTNELDASLTGNFKILELPDAFQLFLNRYYGAYINNPKRNINNQDFSFHIKTKNVSDYISLLDKNIKGFDNSLIEGNINLSENTLNIHTTVPQFSYGQTNFLYTDLTGTGTFDSITVTSNIEDIIINDSLHLPGTKIMIKAGNDVSDISIKTTGSKTLNEADLSARLNTFSDGFKLNFYPSSFVINNKKWTLEKGGELALNNKLLTASLIKFIQENQQLAISTEPSPIGNSNDVVVELTKINLSDFVPFVLKTPRIEGLMTGNIRVADPFNNLLVDFETQIEEFRFEDDSVGILKTSGSYSARSGDVIVNALSKNKYYDFIADLVYKTKDSTENQLKGSLVLSRSDIHILEKYLESIFSGIGGNATGRLNITGTAKNPKITGTISLNDATMVVNYTRCRYIIENDTKLNFNTDEIDFGTIKVRDTLNNTATLSGRLYHSFFNNFFFNELHFKTDEKNNVPAKFVLLNTTPKDNKQFYGKVIGRADLSLNGPESDMRMVITGEPTDSSHIYLPTGETAETGKINYIEFIKFGREMRGDLSARQSSNIKVDMDLTANPFVKIDVILDEVTKDVIKAQGSGRLNISAGSTDPLTIRGRYDVQQGEYTFNFQTFLKTPFNLQSGFIEWQGDPYLANLNIDAIYRAEKVNLSSIPTISGYNKSNSIKGDVDIIFKLRGTLKEPRPDFEFQLPFDNPLKSDPIANEYLKTRFQADKNELNRKVTALLLFNTFISDQQGLLTANNTGNFVTRSLGQVLSGTLSSSLSNVFQKIFKTDAVNLYTNINTADFNFEKGNTQEIQNIGNFGVKTSFLNNRLLINFGGNVDYKLLQTSTNSNSNFLFTPDVSFEYLITPDGKLRVIGFNRSDAGIGDIAGLTRRNRTGFLLSYRKDFNAFAELFGNDDRRKK